MKHFATHDQLNLSSFKLGPTVPSVRICIAQVLFSVSYLEHKTNNWVWSKIIFLVGIQELLRATVQRRNSHGLGTSCAVTASPNHPSGHLGGWAMSSLAEEMLGGEHQRVDGPSHARTTHDGLP